MVFPTGQFTLQASLPGASAFLFLVCVWGVESHTFHHFTPTIASHHTGRAGGSLVCPPTTTHTDRGWWGGKWGMYGREQWVGLVGRVVGRVSKT